MKLDTTDIQRVRHANAAMPCIPFRFGKHVSPDLSIVAVIVPNLPSNNSIRPKSKSDKYRNSEGGKEICF